MDEKLMVSLTTLLTGFVVVFMVLLLLIFVIKIYSTIVYNIQNKPKKDKSKKDDDDTPKGTGVGGKVSSSASSTGVSGEVLAAIAAAVDFLYGKGNVRIKNIKKSSSRSAWGKAGVVANTRPF
ncbi:MAG: hypothetical protein E7513_02165 [Ruminococcaceae bacterium]|nr:hypothetical protein [Oscillospiraceae bacterium]